MSYNLALVFDQPVHTAMLEFAGQLQTDNTCEFTYAADSTPHATLIKYATTNPFDPTLTGKTFPVVFSGLTLLPSRSTEPTAGTWVEIAVLIPQDLRDLVRDQIAQLKAEQVESEIGPLLRPHVTLCKLAAKTNISLASLDYELLRDANIIGTLQVGHSDQGFAFKQS